MACIHYVDTCSRRSVGGVMDSRFGSTKTILSRRGSRRGTLSRLNWLVDPIAAWI